MRRVVDSEHKIVQTTAGVNCRMIIIHTCTNKRGISGISIESESAAIG